MVVAQKPLIVPIKQERPAVLEDPLKGAYSHGLESIYAIETIDIKTVRFMLADPPAKEEIKAAEEEDLERQLAIDLGPAFRGWMPPYILEEPIQIIELNKHIEKNLLEMKVCFLKDLHQADFKDMAFIKGFGQGHIEEIRQKLKGYLAGRMLKKTTAIDFTSLLKCLFGAMDRRKAFMLLEPYELEGWISLTPLEKIELKKMSANEKLQWIQNAKNEISMAWLETQWKLLIETWIQPWMLTRGGFAAREELEEALSIRSNHQEVAGKCLKYLCQHISFESCLPKVEGLFAANERMLELGGRILNCARSYFPSQKSYFTMDQICRLIQMEFARHWEEAQAFQITAILERSNDFQVFRDQETGRFSIKRAPCS